MGSQKNADTVSGPASFSARSSSSSAFSPVGSRRGVDGGMCRYAGLYSAYGCWSERLRPLSASVASVDPCYACAAELPRQRGPLLAPTPPLLPDTAPPDSGEDCAKTLLAVGHVLLHHGFGSL